MKVKIKRFDKNLPLPSMEDKAAGLDLFCREDVTIAPHKIALVPVNIAVEVPDGYFLLIAIRSSTPLKKGLLLANGIGVVDPFYCGDEDEIVIELLNYTDQPVLVKRGEQLAQCFLIKRERIEWEEMEKLGNSGRGGYKV